LFHTKKGEARRGKRREEGREEKRKKKERAILLEVRHWKAHNGPCTGKIDVLPLHLCFSLYSLCNKIQKFSCPNRLETIMPCFHDALSTKITFLKDPKTKYVFWVLKTIKRIQIKTNLRRNI
jgi:hypothetical protein